MKNILIIGGYGAVGSIIAEKLSDPFPEKVIIAGRNLEKAETLSKQLNGKVLPLFCDINDLSKYDSLLEDISLVIMCLDQKKTYFAELCFKKGIHYIDITADYDFLSQLEKLNHSPYAVKYSF